MPKTVAGLVAGRLPPPYVDGSAWFHSYSQDGALASCGLRRLGAYPVFRRADGRHFSNSLRFFNHF
jgi:hypothetical protein